MRTIRILTAILVCSLTWASLTRAGAQTFSFTPGNFYGSQGSNIVSYTPSGSVAGTLHPAGTNDFRGLAFGPDGLLYAVSVNGNGFNVLAIDGTGQVRLTYSYTGWIGGNISWGKIAFDGQGAFYVGTYPGVVRFTMGSTQSGTIVPHTDGPYGIYDLDVLPSGNLLVADSYSVFELTSAGDVVRQFTSLTDIRGVVYDPTTNQVFVTELGNSGTGYFRLLRYDYATAAQLGATSFWYGDDIVLASDGRLVVGSRTQAPGIFDKDLNQLGSFQGNATMFVTQLAAAPRPSVAGDFNGDGSTDLVWQNDTTGVSVCWYMNAAQWFNNFDYLGNAVQTEWKIAGVADLNGDKSPDMIWQSTKSGDVVYWLMNGTGMTSFGYIARNVGVDWKIVSTADLNGDGKPDLIWQNTKTGDVIYWLMNGTQWAGNWDYIAHGVAAEWRIAGAADLNADGKPDLVWQNTKTGDVIYWLMNGTQFAGNWNYIAHNVATEWKIVSLSDYSGDGKPDLIWQNTKTGDVIYWLMNGTQFAGNWNYIAHNVPTPWSPIGPR